MSTSNDSSDSTEEEEEEEYTTSYTKLLQQRAKLAHLSYNNNDMHSKRSSNSYSSLNDYIFTSDGQNNNYYSHRNSQKRGMQQGRKEWGVRLIQQRWRGSGGYHDVTTNDFAQDDYDVSKGRLNDGEKYGAVISNSSSSRRHEDDEGQQKRLKRRRANSLLSFSDHDTSLSPPNNFSNFTTYNSSTLNNKTAAQPQLTSSIQPPLLFRRTNSSLYYSNERLYTNIQFLTETSNVVIGVDNYGDLDVVRVPSSSLFNGGRGGGCGGCVSDGGGGASSEEDEENNTGGMGTLQADRLPLCNNNIHHANDGPRYPMNKNFYCEVFGYENGSKFVVGLQSGGVKLFTTEHSHAAAAAWKCLDDQGGGEDSPTLGSTTNLWSCLPSTSTVTIGPQRRYHRNDDYSLATMLTSNNNTAQTTTSSVFDAYNTSFLEEISNWDNNTDQYNPNQNHSLLGAKRYPWAFREGGSLSSTALIGVCVDAEGDCFSLRVIDERLLQQRQTKNGSDSSCDAMMKVVVVDDRNTTSLNCRESVESLCFTGEYGLVTSHSIAQNNDEIGSELTATCLKWWDHRMLRSHEPVSSMCLSFPRDNVSLLSPDVERCIMTGTTGTPASMRVLSTEQPLDRTNFGLFQVNRLIGSRDSSDRFAIHLKVGSHENHHGHDEVLMIDSCRGEITQQIRNASHGGMSLCMSSYLDTMACYTMKEDEQQCISIYDVSRSRTDDIVASRQDPFEYLSGKKRQLQNDEVSNDDEMNNEGLLRRLLPKVTDRYGIDSSLSCVAIDEYGAAIVCGTSDGDMFLLNSSDLDELITQNTFA